MGPAGLRVLVDLPSRGDLRSGAGRPLNPALEIPGTQGTARLEYAAMSNRRPRHWALCLVLLVATLVAYGRTYQFDFINFDDDVYVTDNEQVRNGLTVDGIGWAFTTFYASNWLGLPRFSRLSRVLPYPPPLVKPHSENKEGKNLGLA